MTYLDGVRVLDLSRVLAGPYATQILADLGAEVLKVESPRGDDTRRWGPPFAGDSAAYYWSVNRDKASLVADLKDEATREGILRLAEVADVWVDNFPPAVAERLGLGPETLRKRAPKLVAMSIHGYRGERRNDPGYDLVLQAESGLMGITGPQDGEPHKVGVAVVDVLTGTMAANGILAALVRRGRTGEGATMSISLFQTALASLVNIAQNHLATGEPTRRWGNRHPNLAPYETFPTGDGTIVLGIGNDDQYRRLLALLEIDDPDLASLDNAGRVARRDEVAGRIEERTRERERDPLLEDLHRERIPAAPVLRPDEAIARATAWNPSAVFALDHPSLGRQRFVGSPFEGDGLRAGHRPPPGLGEGGEELADRWLARDNGK